MKQVRILVIGDEAVGKTSLIERYVNEKFLMNHSPTVINEYVKYTKFHELHIRDCSALPEFKSIRFLQYAEVDIVLFCFNLATIGTLDNLKLNWLPEVKEHCGDAVRILIGCKNDLDSIINEGLIVQMQDYLKISKFVKCSAKNNENVDAVFGTALNAVYQSRSMASKGPKPLKKSKKRKS